MAAWEYIALDSAGRRRRGVVEGESGRHVRQLLRDGGLTLLELTEVARRPAASGTGMLFAPRLPSAQVALLTRLLATLLRSGLPIDDALAAIAAQADDAAVKRVVLGIRARVVEGHTLAAGFEQYPGIFPDVFIATVAAGEQTRHLPLVLERLAEHMEERQQLRQKLNLALIYPAVLVLTALVIVVGLLTWVVPEIVSVFAGLGRELPLLTRALIAASGFVRSHGLALVAGGLASVVALGWLLKRPVVRRRVDALKLTLPLVRRFARESAGAALARTLAILIGSGVPLVDALRIAARAIDNRVLQDVVVAAAERVREGAPLARALGDARRLPPLTVHLVASGEAAGNLEQMLDTAARAHEREIAVLLGTFMAVVEPFLILAMGLMVLGIVIAILLPIFELNQIV